MLHIIVRIYRREWMVPVCSTYSRGPEQVRERRNTGDGGGTQPDLHLHACMWPYSSCPIDNSRWADLKISGVQEATPEVSLQQPVKQPVRCSSLAGTILVGWVLLTPSNFSKSKCCFPCISPSFCGSLLTVWDFRPSSDTLIWFIGACK